MYLLILMPVTCMFASGVAAQEQHGEYCGYTSASTILRRFGIQSTTAIEELSQKRNASFYDLRLAFEKAGFIVEAFRLNSKRSDQLESYLGQINSGSRGAILCIYEQRIADGGHFVVVDSYDNDSLTVFDPIRDLHVVVPLSNSGTKDLFLLFVKPQTSIVMLVTENLDLFIIFAILLLVLGLLRSKNISSC